MFKADPFTKFCLLTLIMLIAPMLVTGSRLCKWANEDCDNDEDCCSETCSRQHEGTNYRCETSPIHFPCFFSYQCADGLLCGEHYECCSAYWGVCSKLMDCCNSSHVCRETDGFIYKRCLTPSFSPPQVSTTNSYLLIFIVLHACYNILDFLQPADEGFVSCSRRV